MPSITSKLRFQEATSWRVFFCQEPVHSSGTLVHWGAWLAVVSSIQLDLLTPACNRFSQLPVQTSLPTARAIPLTEFPKGNPLHNFP